MDGKVKQHYHGLLMSVNCACQKHQSAIDLKEFHKTDIAQISDALLFHILILYSLEDLKQPNNFPTLSSKHALLSVIYSLPKQKLQLNLY